LCDLCSMSKAWTACRCDLVCNAMQSSEIIQCWRLSVIGSCPACSTPQVRRTSNQVHTGPRQKTAQARAQPYGRWMVQRASAGTPATRARLIRVALARVDSPGPRALGLLLPLLQLRLCERGQSAPRQGQQSSASGGYSPELAVGGPASPCPAIVRGGEPGKGTPCSRDLGFNLRNDALDLTQRDVVDHPILWPLLPVLRYVLCQYQGSVWRGSLSRSATGPSGAVKQQLRFC
jgi:hypothetical protein